MIKLTSREDIVAVYHDMFKGIGEYEHIFIEINVVLGTCSCNKIISPTLGIPKIQLLNCTSNFTVINSKVRTTVTEYSMIQVIESIKILSLASKEQRKLISQENASAF